MEKVVNLDEAFGAFDEPWSPRVVARVNDYDVKIAHVRGEFVWHEHPETDEFFLVTAGSLTIHLGGPDNGTEVTLGPGDVYVVGSGTRHRPEAENGTRLVLFEPRGTINTVRAGGPGTAGSSLP